MEKLIIDTDPGVDDAEAILMAAAHPNATIAAILAVGGNVGLEHTLRNSLTIVEMIEQDVPVYAGCDKPLVIFQEDAAFVHGEDGLGDVGYVPQSRQPEAEHAALALIRMANEAPGEYTLVAIGPLTNIAVALKLDPTLPEKLKRMVVMGGAVTAHGNTSNVSAEFNIYHDPEAAHVVFEAWEQYGGLIELIDWESDDAPRHSRSSHSAVARAGYAQVPLLQSYFGQNNGIYSQIYGAHDDVWRRPAGNGGGFRTGGGHQIGGAARLCGADGDVHPRPNYYRLGAAQRPSRQLQHHPGSG